MSPYPPKPSLRPANIQWPTDRTAIRFMPNDTPKILVYPFDMFPPNTPRKEELKSFGSHLIMLEDEIIAG